MISRANVLSKFTSFPHFFCKCNTSTDSQLHYKLFFDPKVQEILKKLTNVDINKVFEPKRLGKPPRNPKYELLTQEELDEQMKIARHKAEILLQIPPFLAERKEINEVLSEDPSLDGFDIHHSKFVFTDISHDLPHRNRIIVVREPNGTLRKANWNERDRLLQVYFPQEGKELEPPKMFEDEYLNDVLDREEYKFILDRACVQFEPDDPVYIKVTAKTYERINEKKHFTHLYSTRHFGSLTYYLVVNSKIDVLLEELIKSEKINDALLLIELYALVHPDCKFASKSQEKTIEDLEKYIKLESKNSSVLELALQTYLSKNIKEECSAV